MGHRSLIRHGLLACSLLFLIVLAWKALSGAFRQIPQSHTVGQKAETVIQVESGSLSLLVVLTRFWHREWAEQVHTAWSISLAAAAGISSLVWGPPMPFISVLFAAIALLVTRTIKWALQTSPQAETA